MADDTIAETLLAHSKFVRSVALSLATGEIPAEDIEQEVWLTTVSARYRPVRSERGWLHTVARSAFLKLSRDRASRRLRERKAARSEPQPPSDDILARREIRRFIVAEVDELKEPYREAILLRFYEDMPPSGIARRLGIPVATVKSHLYRGLKILRARLEQRLGDSERRYSVAMLAASGLRPHGLAPVDWFGTPASIARVAAALGLIAVILSLVVLVFRPEIPWRVSDPESTGTSVASVGPERGAGVIAVGETDDSTRAAEAVAKATSSRYTLPPLVPEDYWGIQVKDQLRGDRLPIAGMRLVPSEITADLRGAGFRSDRDDPCYGVFAGGDIEPGTHVEIQLPTDLGGLTFRRSLDAPDETEARLLTFRVPAYACVDVSLVGVEEHDGAEVFVSPIPPLDSVPEHLLEQELTSAQRSHLAALEHTMPSLYVAQLRYIVQSAWTMQPGSIVDREDIADVRIVDVLRGQTRSVFIEPRLSPQVEGTVLDTHGRPIAGAHVGVLVDRYFDGTEPAPVRQIRRGGPCFLAQDRGQGVHVYLTEVGATDELGAYRVPVTFTATVQVYVVADGYHTEFSEVKRTARIDDSLERLDVTLREITDDERVRMRVVDSNGEPRAGDWFYPRLTHNPLCRYPRLVPDSDGYVDVTHLVPGAAYNVMADDDWSHVGVAPNSFQCEPEGVIRIDWGATN